MATLQEEAARLHFFEYIFGEKVGWLEIGTKAYNSSLFESTYFRWPHQAKEVFAFIESRTHGYNVWFCTSLLSIPKRNKGNITECTCLWADLDTCAPEHLEHPKPNIIIQSSPGRYQAMWSLSHPVQPNVAEEYSKRIAYKYAEFGADIGCWNLGRLLRVPFTYNYKYNEPVVELVTCLNLKYPVDIFQDLEEVSGSKININLPIPDFGKLPASESVIAIFRMQLPEHFFPLHYDIPDEDSDWSELFWKELRLCFESGMTLEQVYAVSLDSACNKFVRDSRPPAYTWKDVTRAYAISVQNIANAEAGWSLPSIVDREDVPTEPTFVERYVTWAMRQTDAPAGYHQLSAFIILSALLSKTVRIPTSIGVIKPNIWGMILADTTLTRKTTAMDLATDLLDDVLEDTVVATDGSVEGLMQALSQRNGQASMFKRDEVTGLVDQFGKKEYLSGMLELFTQLYDGKNIKRVLKKETISVAHPVFLMYVGGIKERMASILNHEHISSGFIPRFLVVSAESQPDSLRPMGRRTEESNAERDDLIKELREYKARYCDDIVVTSEVGTAVMTAPEVNAELTDEAWETYNEMETTLVRAGLAADQKEYLTPILDRMSKSMLKMAVITAAARQIPENGVINVTKSDICRAAWFIQQWVPHMIELVGSLGMSYTERSIQKFLRYVRNHEGCLRSDIMQSQKLSAQDMETMMRTLEMRGLIRTEKHGKGIKLWTTK